MKWIRALSLATALQAAAWALPEGGQVRQGDLQMQSQGNVLQILQNSPQGIINWQAFSISPNEIVRFLQPAQGITLNRVVGDQASLIQGLLQANGQVFLLNPNGILIGPGATIQAGSFLASTLDMTDENFLQGRYLLHQMAGKPLTALINQGQIQVNDGGYVVLAAPLVSNEGLIVAHQGQVGIGASTQATVSFDPGGLLHFSIPDGWRGTSGGEAGAVLLTQGQVTDTVASVLGVPKTEEALLLPARSGVAINSGSIDTQGPTGGQIFIDSSQGSVNRGVLNASASAAGGQGGKIELLSAGTSIALGQILARGGEGGQGGFVEISGASPQVLVAPDVSAPGGQAGTFLLDPTSIAIVDSIGNLDGSLPTITNGTLPPTGTVSVAALQSVAPGTTILLQATNSVNWIGGTIDNLTLQNLVNLQVESGGNIFFNPGKSIVTNQGDVVMTAENQIQAPGIHAVNGNIKLHSNAGGIVLAGDLIGNLIELKAPNGNVDAVNQVMTATTGVNVEALSLLGDSTAPNNSNANINSVGPLNLTITGPDLSFAGAAAKVRGTLSGGVNLSTSSTTGSIFINDVQVYPTAGGGGATTTGGGGGQDALTEAEAAELRRQEEVRHDVGAALLNLGNYETYYEVNSSHHEHLPVRNLGLSDSHLIPIYTLDLVALQVLDDDDHYWRKFISQFVIWEDSSDEAEH